MVVTFKGAISARIWIDELPPWRFPASQHMERTYPTPEPGKAARREAAVELFKIPDKQQYGGLAIRFTPGEDGQLHVRIPSIEDALHNHGTAWADGLRGARNHPDEQPRIGLPHEYADGILKGIEDGHVAALLGAGTLSFPGATHSPADSSPLAFTTLTRILLDVLARADAVNTTDEEWRVDITDYYRSHFS